VAEPPLRAKEIYIYIYFLRGFDHHQGSKSNKKKMYQGVLAHRSGSATPND
jgi:hypothetical protein